jgi:LuxR family quorum sensing-dependent transcriptional regulator
MLAKVMAKVEGVIGTASPEDASARFFAAMKEFGATYLQTRNYRRPRAALTSQSHWAAGGFLARFAPPGWPGSDAFNYVCFECNPLLGAIRENRTRYRFADFAPHGERRFGAYWEAMSEAGIEDALCATSYGADGAIASLHLGFDRNAIPADEALAIQLAGLVLTERLIAFALPAADSAPMLTARERDCLTFVADGKTDWEISVILGIAEGTARFHIDNGRRKLGAINRAQAVARMVNQRLI